MSLACRQEDRITHDRVSLAGKQTKRERESGCQRDRRQRGTAPAIAIVLTRSIGNRHR